MEKELTFEEALKQLELLVKDLESGTLALEKSLDKYQEGVKLAKYCHDLLQKAEAVVVKMVKDNELVDFPKLND